MPSARDRFLHPVVAARTMPLWCIGNPLADMFGAAVLSAADLNQLCEIIVWGANQGLIEGTSLHDDDAFSFNPSDTEDDLNPRSETSDRIAMMRELFDANGVMVHTMTCNLHANPLFRKGGTINPDPQTRDLVRRKVERCIRIGARLKAKKLTYWVARDGFNSYAVVDWRNVYQHTANALNHARSYITQHGFTNYKGGTIEPKPDEPLTENLIPTAGHAVGFIATLDDPDWWGVNPELLQHEGMTLLNAVTTVAFLVHCRKLSFLHFGGQSKGKFDCDFPPMCGTEGLKETAFMFWVLKLLKWCDTVEYDCHMYRSDGDASDPIGCRQQFIEDCSTGLQIALAGADRIQDHADRIGGGARVDLRSTMELMGLNPNDIAKAARKST